METPTESRDDEFDGSSCFERQECIDELIREAPEGCLYCLLETPEDDD